MHNPDSAQPRTRRSTIVIAVTTVAVLGAAVTAGVVGVATPAQAAFPEKPIRIVVPFAPGGGTDMIARVVAEGMSKDLGKPIIVENKPGAGTIIGSDYVAKSDPDGYTMVIATFAHAVNPSMMPKMPFQTDKAFAPALQERRRYPRGGQSPARQADLRFAGQWHFGPPGWRAL
jgi:tripartite-type tricarboxylate transporter receptor subunit TctC